MKKVIFLAVLSLLSTKAFAEFSNESELTVILNGGNTEQETWNGKTMNAYKMNKNTFKLGGHYSYGKADGELNTRNWDVNSRYERDLGKEWSGFAAVQLEEDFFANIEYRWNYDLGGGYNIFKTEKHKMHAEAGYRRTLESDYSGQKTSGSKVRIYSEYTRQHDESLFFKFWVEALPNISNDDDWMLSFEPSANYSLSKTFTLKIGYLHKYDNLPPVGSKKSDYTYTTSLLARF